MMTKDDEIERLNAEVERCSACGREPNNPLHVDCSECGDFRPGAAAHAAALTKGTDPSSSDGGER
jgi:hypothetical protein